MVQFLTKFINKRLRYKSFSPVRTKNGDCFMVRSFTLGPDRTKISPVRSGLLLWDQTALKSVQSGPVRSGQSSRCRTNVRADRGLCRADARVAIVDIWRVHLVIW